MTDYLNSRPLLSESRLRTPQTPRSARLFMPWDDDLPVIDPGESFGEVTSKFVDCITKHVDAAYTYQQLSTTFGGHSLKPMILRLSDECHHPAVVAALLAAKYIFEETDDEGTGISKSRGLACEIVAWQFLTFLAERELIDYLLYDVPDPVTNKPSRQDSTLLRDENVEPDSVVDENAPLLASRPPLHPTDDGQGTSPPQHSRPRPRPVHPAPSAVHVYDFGEEETHVDAAIDSTVRSLAGMNALEVAGVASAKIFLSQRPVQKIVDDIWNGNVMFWENLSVEAVRHARTYNKKVADPFIRLRVPRYQRAFQIGFFVSFLALYFAAIVGPSTEHITPTEALLYWWIAAFAYDEFGEIQDTGILFYRVDFWSLWDIGIIGVSIAFVIMRIYGLVRRDDYVTSMAFDVLSMVALFLVPRIFSVMSLNPYFGSLIPVLKEMTKAFLKFLPVILVLYLGFLTTFTMLAREHMSFREVSWVLVDVFFGSSYLGFDVSTKISPHFGYPLMLIFVCLTNIVLITSLVSLVSNSLTEVMTHARMEYLFQYSIYVLESSSSRRLTYFMPPLNLIPLLLLRPLRLVLSSDHVRRIRIVVLKATHVPFLILIWAYEGSIRLVTRGSSPSSSFTRNGQLTPRPLSAVLQIDRERYARRPYLREPISTLTKATPTNGPIESASVIADPDLVKLIQKMSSQIDELSAIVAAQQQASS